MNLVFTVLAVFWDFYAHIVSVDVLKIVEGRFLLVELVGLVLLVGLFVDTVFLPGRQQHPVQLFKLFVLVEHLWVLSFYFDVQRVFLFFWIDQGLFFQNLQLFTTRKIVFYYILFFYLLEGFFKSKRQHTPLLSTFSPFRYTL